MPGSPSPRAWLAAARRPPAIAVAVAVIVVGEIIVFVLLHLTDNGGGTKVTTGSSTTSAVATTSTTQLATTTSVATTSTTVAGATATTRTTRTTRSQTTVPRCPASQPTATVSDVTVTNHEDGTQDYTVRVAGGLTNTTGQRIHVTSIDVAIYTGDSQVGTGSSGVNQTVAPGESIGWGTEATVHSPSGPPGSAQVTNVSFTFVGCT